MREPALFVFQGAAQNGSGFFFTKRIQHEHATAGKQRARDFKGRILSGRTNQSYRAILDSVQERVLLAFIESMNLVDKENCAVSKAQLVARVGDRFAQILDAGKNGRQRNESGLTFFGKQTGERGFAGSRR